MWYNLIISQAADLSELADNADIALVYLKSLEEVHFNIRWFGQSYYSF
jgi:hypothetical protein